MTKLTVILPISSELPRTIEETKKSILDQKGVDVDLIEIFDDNFARAVNTGVEQAKTELCCVIHDDVILPEDNILSSMIKTFITLNSRDTNIKILETCGIIPNWEELSLVEKYLRAWENYGCEIGYVSYTDEKFFIFYKSFIEEIGGLNIEFYICCEDMDLG